MTLIPQIVIGDVEPLEDATGLVSPRIVTAQGQGLQSLATNVAQILANPPQFDGADMFLFDVTMAGGGAGQNYVAQLTFRRESSGAFATRDGGVFAVPYEGQTKQGLDLTFARAVKIIVQVPGDPFLIGAPVAGAGAGAHYVGLMFWALKVDPETGAPRQVPAIQSGRIQLDDGVAQLTIPTGPDTVVLVTLDVQGPAPLAQQYRANVSTVGLAGVVDIEALDDAGAVVATETSRVQWFAYSPG